MSTLIDKFHETDQERYLFDDEKYYEQLEYGRNFLIISLKDKAAYWEPSSNTNRYLTDYKFWKLKFWLNPALRYFDQQYQINAAVKLCLKMGTQVEPFVSDPYSDKESASFEDINERIEWVKTGFKIFFSLIAFSILLLIFFAIVSVPFHFRKGWYSRY
ncbi:hypothetical protein [Companilactobacillus furfuricola]|uniref:hypothetical protein n=1 Tax=Companilactobacillus furfuricola TaxID=1462575 RepID=UPI000F7984D4|nr:hypothetical protein [Companilactobacillus furfuricola]